MGDVVDVIVIGAGPSGLAAAAACVSTGLVVRCIDSSADAPWYPNFGIWADDAVRAGIEAETADCWQTARFVGPDGTERTLRRAYATVNKQALQTRLLREIGPDALVKSRVSSLICHPDHVEVTLEDESVVRARIVVDAGGTHSRFTRYEGPPSGARQTAFGVEIRVEAGLDPTRFTLMDWGHSFDDGGPPGFLYVVPRGDDVVFVEETVLAADPAFDIDRLRARLDARLSAMDVRYTRVDSHEERCSIVMGSPLPVRTGRVVAFGAAAGLVHPASGYLLGHTLPLAAPLADAVAGAIAERRDPSSAAWEAVWPAERVTAWRLYQFGLEVLLDLDQAQLGGFFDTFLQLPESRWGSYLSARGGGAAVAGVMAEFFARAPWGLRQKLISAGIGREGFRLARALLR